MIKMQGLFSHHHLRIGRTMVGVGSPNARRLQAAKRQDASKEGGEVPSRLTKLFEKYDAEGLIDQQEELEARVSRRAQAKGERSPRSSRKSRSLYTEGLKELQQKREKYFYRRVDGSWAPRYGIHGNGEPQWWALRVTIGREKQVCTAIERKYQQLMEDEGSDLTTEDEIKTRDLVKRVSAWNIKTEKMGNKLIRYKGGGWVLLYACLNETLTGVLSGNVNVLGFHFREIFEGKEFPIPVSEALIDELEEWQEDLSPITEEKVRSQLGLPPAKAMANYDDYDEKMYDRKDRRKKDRRTSGLFTSDSDSSWDSESAGWYSGANVSSDTENGDYSGPDDGSWGSEYLSSMNWDDSSTALNWADGEQESSRADTEGKLRESDRKHKDVSDRVDGPSFQSIVDDGIWGSSFSDIDISDESSYGDVPFNLDWAQDLKVESHPRFTSKQRSTSQGDRRRESNQYDDLNKKKSYNQKAYSDDEMDLAWWDDGDKGNGDEDESNSDSSIGLVENTIQSEWDVSSHSINSGAGSSDIAEGVPIEVISGPFKDFEGVVMKLEDGSEKIQAEIDVFGKQTTVEVKKEDIKVIINVTM
eukprot:jgi/Picsp_1/5554/NSC_02913-R1_transcription antitermination protein